MNSFNVENVAYLKLGMDEYKDLLNGGGFDGVDKVDEEYDGDLCFGKDEERNGVWFFCSSDDDGLE
jgi:hypothetical protein